MKRVKSARHVALSCAYPPDLNPTGHAMTGPHLQPKRQRAKRFLLLAACALAVFAFRYLTA